DEKGSVVQPKYWSNAPDVGMYDRFDQMICTMAKRQGIDTLIFQHEMGSHRSVSEILDTRDDSYQHLIRITGRNFVERPWYSPDKTYPTIWFAKQDGFLVDGQCCLDFEWDNQPLSIVRPIDKDR